MKQFAGIAISLFIVLSLGLSIATAAQYSPEVHQAQKALKVRGYDPGTPDGLWGKSTESAIKHFQVDNDLSITGKLDEQTKAKLGITSTLKEKRVVPVKRKQANKESRIALVIGNSAYRFSPLINPVNDAKDMTVTLRNLGFAVMHKANANQRTMENAIYEFGQRLKKGGVGLFYFSGHGIQANGRNYLIPTKTTIRTERDIKYEAVDAGRVLDGMHEAGNGLNIVLLDACRNNPFAKSFRTGNRGLTRMDAPTGTFITYATAPGSIAADGIGRNGIFTKHLLKNMTKQGLKIEDIMKKVRIGVLEETGNKQVPWQISSLTGDFYFASSAATVSSPSIEPTPSFLEINTNVTGAQVLVDGQVVGTTPVSGIKVSPGSHRFRVEKEGYEAYEKQVRVEAGRTYSMQVHLDEKKPKKGRLYVDTDPKDAKVNIPGVGGFYQGMELEPDRYRVEVSASGYETKELSVTIEAGEDKSLDIRLERLITSTPKTGSDWKGPATGMEFVWVPEGCYEMGCGSWDGNCESDEKPVHEVCVGGFWIGKYEVTIGQWKKVMGNNPSYFKKGDKFPIEDVSWNDVKDFIKRLNQKNGGNKFRLPTEAEWEYAARSGGKPEKYAGGNNVEAVAWHWENSGDTTHPVGTKESNGLGIYDMSGNVWEWCEDIYSKDAYSKHQRNNPIYTVGGSFRVVRGGGWTGYVRSASRYSVGPVFRFHFIGFRLVRTPIGPKDGEITRDGHYTAYASGVVYDTETGLEWVAGPDKDTDWNEAKLWVDNLKVAGGGWRMPTIEELETLYQKGKGDRNMTPLLKTTGWYVWSGETKDSWSARDFYFGFAGKGWRARTDSTIARAFAVRSRR